MSTEDHHLHQHGFLLTCVCDRSYFIMFPGDLDTVTIETEGVPEGRPGLEVISVNPFPSEVRNQVLVLLHGGACLNANGYYGPHKRCYDECPLSKNAFKDYSQHRFVCNGEDCTYRYCKESVELYSHFVRCVEKSCGRCQDLLSSILDEFKEWLQVQKKFDLVEQLATTNSYSCWKSLVIKNSMKKWVRTSSYRREAAVVVREEERRKRRGTGDDEDEDDKSRSIKLPKTASL